MTTAAVTSDFFARVRERLTLEVPAGLYDDGYVPQHGDHDLDRLATAMAAVRSSP